MAPTRPSVGDKRQNFARLHASGCFAIPNPWDPGSARYLQSLGFKAIATTSSGFAWSQARADNQVSRQQVLEHLQAMVAAVDIPVNADFEGGKQLLGGRFDQPITHIARQTKVADAPSTPATAYAPAAPEPQLPAPSQPERKPQPLDLFQDQLPDARALFRGRV